MTIGRDVPVMRDNKGKNTNLIRINAIISVTIRLAQESLFKNFQDFFKYSFS